ncbi:hypothetical protein RYH80_08545 [Halobaculum sp. MBLA0147]|uniref:hypothetical protein n=1 Tax=Halobaculum sp. MBLA0147 TaxID=3079934 RepID=UPI0035240397
MSLTRDTLLFGLAVLVIGMNNTPEGNGLLVLVGGLTAVFGYLGSLIQTVRAVRDG